MPRPAYIVCAQSGSVDQYTNRASMFDIVEVFKASQRPTSAEEVKKLEAAFGEDAPTEDGLSIFVAELLRLRILCTWMRSPEDSPTDRFESQIAIVTPDGQDFVKTVTTPTLFTQVFHRVFVPEMRLPGFPGLGTYLVEGRLRREGATDWEWRQSFPFVVQEDSTPKRTKSHQDGKDDEKQPES